jgi:hypothetical protein
MAIVSGPSSLIIDGQLQPGCSIALENAKDPNVRKFGFLSIPPDLLKRVQSAGQLGMQLASGEMVNINLLHLHPAGVALFSIPPTALEKPPQSVPVPSVLTSILKLRALIEDQLKAEGFLHVTVILQADADKSRLGKWYVKEIIGDDDLIKVQGVLDRLVPELQKRFRLYSP